MSFHRPDEAVTAMSCHRPGEVVMAMCQVNFAGKGQGRVDNDTKLLALNTSMTQLERKVIKKLG